MSADNWQHCPRCIKKRKDDIEAQRKEVEDLYGEVPVDEWELAKGELAAMEEGLFSRNQTLREDYEFFGLGYDEDGETEDDGTVLEIRYKGQCMECGLTLEFKHSVQVDMYQPVKGNSGD